MQMGKKIFTLKTVDLYSWYLIKIRISYPCIIKSFNQTIIYFLQDRRQWRQEVDSLYVFL